VAAAEREEAAGNSDYHTDHMGTIFKKGFSFSGYERDLLSWNLDRGFVDISGVSGVDSISDGRGAAVADFDNDGDSDIFLVAEQGEAHFLFRNNVGNQRNWLRIELVGDAAGRDAFGAVVRLEGAAGRLMKAKSGGIAYLSQSDPRLLFGLGDASVAGSVEVTWPGGERQSIGDVPANQAIRITQGRDSFERLALTPFSLVDPLDDSQRFMSKLGFRVGERFPDLSLKTLDGTAAKLEQTSSRGRKRLVNLWATWCTPCSKEIPELQALRPKLARAGIDLVGLSVDSPESLEFVPQYLADRSVSYPVFTTDEAGLERLFPDGEVTVPITLLLDDSGTLLRVFSGWSARTEAEILSLGEYPASAAR